MQILLSRVAAYFCKKEYQKEIRRITAHVSLLILVVTIILSISIDGVVAIVENHFVYASSVSASSSSTEILSDFNFAAVGDWGCTEDMTGTVNNILDKNPELVLGLGDFSYEDTADCWFEKIEPIDNLMKIAIGNHDVTGSKLIQYMEHFDITSQYYSFDYQKIHFIALATESEYLDMSTAKAQEQLAFVKSDLEKASANPDIDWIIPFFHRMMYYEEHNSCSIVNNYDYNLVDIYHPLFEKYGVNLVLQAHSHTYERTYPLKFNSEETEEPIVTSKDSSNYRSADGLVIATVGTAGVGTAGVYPTRLFISDALAPVQYTDTRGFLNVDVSSDGTTLVGTFYDNDNGDIKDQFTITKSSTSSVPTSTVGEEEENDNADDQMAIEEELDNELLDDNNEDDEVSLSDGENVDEEFSDGN